MLYLSYFCSWKVYVLKFQSCYNVKKKLLLCKQLWMSHRCLKPFLKYWSLTLQLRARIVEVSIALQMSRGLPLCLDKQNAIKKSKYLRYQLFRWSIIDTCARTTLLRTDAKGLRCMHFKHFYWLKNNHARIENLHPSIQRLNCSCSH